ncbi:MAG: S-layer homology domain-containing protein [Clostridia bacterium]|nr:S-layer homology domain-containing protein [Clostridia bacterium]
MKKIISLILLVVILFSCTVYANGESLVSAQNSDTDYVQKASDIGITNANDTYNYPEAIKREDFCNLVYNFVINVIKAPIPKANINFTDTSSVKVNVLCDLGIIKGKTDGIFAPGDFLTREEAAVVVVRTVNSLMPVPVTEMYYNYSDEAMISHWAKDSVQIVSNLGVMQGTGSNLFSPQNTYTTQEAIITLVRLSDVYINNYIPKSGFTDNLNSHMPTDKNYMFSPLSIKMAFALASNGASGQTKAEILKALGISDLEKFNEFSKELISKYSQTENLKLNIANSIWINKDRTKQEFSQSFKQLAKDYYDAEVKTVDNKNAVKEVNSWVSDKTNGKIPSVISSPDFWASIINAIYFKGAWKNEFNSGATKKDAFTFADGTKADIDFMNKTSWMSVLLSDEATAVELPYKTRFDKVSSDGSYIGTDSYPDLDVSMYLIMPKDNIAPEKFLNDAISSQKFEATYTAFSMPKFKIEFDTGLNGILNSMGIQSAFIENKADFKNMFDSGNMYVTSAIHKTYIAVDEKGTEAAAVTALMMAGTALPPKPTEVKFNRPFYFIIRDNTSGESLFVGRYAFA